MLETPPELQQSQVPPKKSRKDLSIVFITLAVILIGSCVVVLLSPFYSLYHEIQSANDSAATYSAEQDATREVEEATQAVPLPTNASISFSSEEGGGDLWSSGLSSYEHIFRFQQGLAIFTFTHDGKADFMVDLRNPKGDILYDLVNATGSFDGSTANSIPNAGVYTVFIYTDGKWTATVEQPRPTTAPYTTSFQGKGQAATSLFRMNSGLKTIHMTHDGTSNFNVRLLDSNGNVVSSLASETGTFHGSKVEDIHNDGIYLFDVEADGNWTITIQ